MFENLSIFSKIVPATVKSLEDRLAHARGDLVAGALLAAPESWVNPSLWPFYFILL